DYMTNSRVTGLNSYSKQVLFGTVTDMNYDSSYNHDVQVKSDKVPGELIPAGFHCYNATPQQAFHFGLYRVLKNQSDIINSVRMAYIKSVEKGFRDDIRAFALAGADAAADCQGLHNYTDEHFLELFKMAKEKISMAD